MDRRSALGVIAGMVAAPFGVPAGTPLSEKSWCCTVDNHLKWTPESGIISPMIWIMHRGDGLYSWFQPVGGDGRWHKIHLSYEAQKSLYW